MTNKRDNMITIKEFYDWAVENGVENLPFGISLENLDKTCDYYCEELNSKKHEFEIGGFYTTMQRPDSSTYFGKAYDFVWICNK